MPRGRPRKQIDSSAGPLAEFATRIAERREELGLSRQELAKGLPCAASTLGEYERGVRPPPDEDFIGDLAQVLELPMDELLVLWRRAAAQSPRRGRRSRPLPPALAERESEAFVGRASEGARLLDAWRSAADGGHDVVVLLGEAGIGKSRIAADLAVRVHAEGATVLYGRSEEDGPSFQPFREGLEHFLGHSGPGELQRLAGRRTPDLVRLVPELAAQIGTVRSEGWGDPDAERFEMFEAAVSVLSAECLAAPVLVVLDDMHWATAATIAMLRHILQAQELSHILVVLAFRSGEPEIGSVLAATLGDLQPTVGITRLELTGLTTKNIAELLHAALPRRTPDPDVATTIHRLTDGNPYFVGAIVEDLAETECEAPADGTEVRIPSRALEALERRLGRLSPSARSILEVASVAGPAIPLPVLRTFPELVSPAASLVTGLDELTLRGVLHEPFGSAGLYTFDHEITRRAIYDHLSTARQGELHRRVGSALRALPTASEWTEPVARHFAIAAIDGDIDDALSSACDAAQSAIRQLAFEDAVAVLDRALATQSFGHPSDPAMPAQVLLLLAEARFALHDLPGYRLAAFEVAAIGRQQGSSELVAHAAGMLSDWGPFVGRPDPELLALLHEGFDAAKSCDEQIRARIQAGLARRQALAEADGWAAEPLAAEAIEVARRVGDSTALAHALVARGAILQGRPCINEQLEIADEVIALGAETQRTQTLVDGYWLRLRCLLERGDLASVHRDIEILEVLGTERRSWTARANAAMYRAVLAQLFGGYDEAERESAAMLAFAGDDPSYVSVWLTQTFGIQHDQGKSEALRRPLVDAIANNPGIVAFRAGQALVEADLRSPQAFEILRELAANDFAVLPRDLTWPGAPTMLAEVCAAVADEDTAASLHPLLEEHRQYLGVLGTTAICTGAVSRFLGMLEGLLGEFDRADASFEEATRLETSLGAEPLLARTRAWHAWMFLHRRAPGDIERADALIEQSLRVSRALGMHGVEGFLRHLTT